MRGRSARAPGNERRAPPPSMRGRRRSLSRQRLLQIVQDSTGDLGVTFVEAPCLEQPDERRTHLLPFDRVPLRRKKLSGSQLVPDRVRCAPGPDLSLLPVHLLNEVPELQIPRPREEV